MSLEVEEALQIIDDLLEEHLTPLQENIIRGIWENKHYKTIAKNTEHQESYITKIACELLQKISLALDEKVNRSKLKTAMKKYKKRHQINIQDNQGFVTFDYCKGVRTTSGNLFFNQNNFYQTDLQETENESEKKE